MNPRRAIIMLIHNYKLCKSIVTCHHLRERESEHFADRIGTESDSGENSFVVLSLASFESLSSTKGPFGRRVWSIPDTVVIEASTLDTIL